MKKSIVSFMVLVLLFSLLAAPAAWAESWSNIGTFSVGQGISPLQLTAYAFDDSINNVSVEGQIPPGCSVDRSSESAPYGLILNGVPTTPGSYTFQIIIDGEVNNYSMTVAEVPMISEEATAPEVPSISVTSAPAICSVGSTTILSISASVSDGGFLSYQWYRNGEAVFNGNDSSISIATTSPGVYSFYCEVTNTLNGVSSRAVSDAILVEVQDGQTAAVISQISISSQPSKITYTAGESLDTSGLVIRATYTDGSTTDITSGFSVSPVQFSSDDIGQKTVTVTYNGKQCSFQVNVKSSCEQSALSVITTPSKTNYYTGDALDTSGLLLRTDGKDITTGFVCSPSTLSTAGTQQITVTYNGLTCYFYVYVQAKDTDQLKIETLPAKTTYLVGESLNTEGLVIEKITDNGSTTKQEISSGFTVEPTILTKAGQQTITVHYENLTATFTVNVSETATPAPTEVLPTQDAAAQAATAAAAAAVNARNERSSRAGLIIFIAVVGVFALVILGVYVYLAKADNIEETKIGKLIQRLMDRMNK